MTAGVLPKGSIQLDHVELTRGPQRFAFDCRIEAEMITAVVGASGSGKTTLLNLIAGFDTPTSGRILMDGTDVTARHPSERPVSLVFQDNNLFAHLDIATNVGLGISPSLHLSPNDRKRIESALSRTGLAGYEKRLPGTLSGGERQRAAFARALVRDRPFLLLDEPFAALDPGLRAAMGGLLSELQSETGVTVVLVTHSPSDVEKLASRVIFLSEGRILADERTGVFFRRTSPGTITDFLQNIRVPGQ